MNILGFFQQFSRALQLPITVLPAAALLLRLGRPDLLNAALIVQAGGAIFDSLALIFAVDVVSSWSKDSADAAALVGTAGCLVLTRTMVTISPGINMGVLADVITGLVDGTTYNRWSDIKLPDFLNFFGGKRFMPVATELFCLVLTTIFGYVWPPVQRIIHTGGEQIISAGALGSGIFSFINRLLIPTGLHQVPNIIAQFQIGEFTNTMSMVFHGDIDRFCTGDDAAGMFMSGFFSIMMFGLLDAALTIYFATPKERHPMVGGMLLSVAVAAFLTGVTEPLEFLFMSLAPLLYLLHALLIDISLFMATLLGIHAGFSFSAGIISYVLVYNLPAVNQNVWMLLMIGVIFFAIYFVVFSLVIRMFNLRAPGREGKEDKIITEEANNNTEEGLTQLATNYIVVIGDTNNLKTIDACITRLRLTVTDFARVNDAMCKRLGTSGVVKLSKQTIQVTVGAKVESVGDATKKVVARSPVATTSAEATPATATLVAKLQAVPNAVFIAELISPITGDAVALGQVPNEAFTSKTVSDGVTVEPTDKIIASPTAGTIVGIFNTSHTFHLGTEKGAEIVVHMGIDTVTLEGRGFKRLVEEGTQISAGQPILEMDLDYLNTNTRSMISPVVYNNINDFSGLIIKVQGHIVAGQVPLYEIKK